MRRLVFDFALVWNNHGPLLWCGVTSGEAKFRRRCFLLVPTRHSGVYRAFITCMLNIWTGYATVEGGGCKAIPGMGGRAGGRDVSNSWHFVRIHSMKWLLAVDTVAVLNEPYNSSIE